MLSIMAICARREERLRRSIFREALAGLTARAGAALLFAGLACSASQADDYPSRPITIIVPFAAGGPSDTMARNLGGTMSNILKQQIVIENVGGAISLGIARASRAQPDGYTLLVTHVGIATAPFMYSRLPYDTVNDFEPIGRVADVPMTLVAKKTLPPSTLDEFITYAKANKEKLSYGHGGAGSSSHLCVMLFMSAIGTDFTAVPYKGNAPAMNDLLGGQIDFMCDQTSNTAQQIQSGAIKVYGVTTKQRIPSMPQIPTLDEQGMKGFEVVIWFGMWAPRGTPPTALEKLNGALRTALQDASFKARLADLGAVPAPLANAAPAPLLAHLKAEIDVWGPIIKKSGILPQ
jgi:tripartite-type tricarboxylate transporter receptor subunit TctC